MITNLGSLLIHRRSIFWRFNFNTRHAWPVYNVLYDATTLTYDFPWVKKKKRIEQDIYGMSNVFVFRCPIVPLSKYTIIFLCYTEEWWCVMFQTRHAF